MDFHEREIDEFTIMAMKDRTIRKFRMLNSGLRDINESLKIDLRATKFELSRSRQPALSESESLDALKGEKAELERAISILDERLYNAAKDILDLGGMVRDLEKVNEELERLVTNQKDEIKDLDERLYEATKEQK